MFQTRLSRKPKYNIFDIFGCNKIGDLHAIKNLKISMFRVFRQSQKNTEKISVCCVSKVIKKQPDGIGESNGDAIIWVFYSLTFLKHTTVWFTFLQKKPAKVYKPVNALVRAALKIQA